MVNEFCKDVEGSENGLFKALSQSLPRGAEENHEKYRIADIRIRSKI
jgi:hypothetical protein